MGFSVKNPGNNKRYNSSVIRVIAFFEGRFVWSRRLIPPTLAYDSIICSVSCVTVIFTGRSIRDESPNGK